MFLIAIWGGALLGLAALTVIGFATVAMKREDGRARPHAHPRTTALTRAVFGIYARHAVKSSAPRARGGESA